MKSQQLFELPARRSVSAQFRSIGTKPRPVGQSRCTLSRPLSPHRRDSFGCTLLRAKDGNCAKLTPAFPSSCKLSSQSDAQLTPLFSISSALFFTLSNLLFHANHLFSSHCALFWKNTRGGVPPLLFLRCSHPTSGTSRVLGAPALRLCGVFGRPYRGAGICPSMRRANEATLPG